MALSNENLFLLEFLVDQVTLRSECDCDRPGELCVSFEFLDHAPLEICENDFRTDQTDEFCAKIGRSCLFSLTPQQINCLLNNFEIGVTILKKFPPDCQSNDKMTIGNALVSITDIFVELTTIIDTNNDEIPPVKCLRDTFDITDASDDVIGKIGLYVGLSCFGKIIITQFQMNFDDNSVLFKDKEGQTLYRYKKVKKSKSSARTCSKSYFNCKSSCPSESCFDSKNTTDVDEIGTNSNCPNEPCFNRQPPNNSGRTTSPQGPWTNPNCPNEPCFNSQPPISAGRAMSPQNAWANANCPAESCFNNQPPNNPGQRPSPNLNYPAPSGCNGQGANSANANLPQTPWANTNCPLTCLNNSSNLDNPNATRYPITSTRIMDNSMANCPQAYFGNETPITAPINQQPFSNVSPIGNSIVPCNECQTTGTAPCYPPTSPAQNMGMFQPCNECGQFPQNPNQAMRGRPPVKYVPPNAGLQPNVTAPMSQQVNSCGDYRDGPGLQQNNQNQQISSNLCTKNDNYTIQPISKSTNDGKDPDKEYFILRIGRKSDNMEQRKNNLELELSTPKCPAMKPKPKMETRDCQYDPKDIGSKGKKGKGKKGKKDKKKKKSKGK